MHDKDFVPEQLRSKFYFGPHLRLLRWCGIPIIPPDDFGQFGKILYYIFCALMVLLIPFGVLTTEAVYLFKHRSSDIDTLTLVLCYLTTHIIGCSKVTLLIWSRKDLWNYCQTLETGLFRPDMKRGGIKEFKIIKNAINHVNFQCIIFDVFVIIVVGNRLLYATFDSGYYEEHYNEATNVTTYKKIRTLPVLSSFPFDTNKSPFYEIATTYQFIALCVFGYIIAASDAMITGFMIHIKAQFLILQNTLSIYDVRATEMWKEKQSAENDGNATTNGVGSANLTLPEGIEMVSQLPEPIMKHARNIIKDCHLHHQQIMVLCEKCEGEYNLLMLIQFLGSLALLCFQLFQLSLTNPRTFRFLSMTSYWILMMFQLLLYCWNGNEVELISSAICNSVYHSNWVVADQGIKKAMLLIMMRAQRPYKLTAGKFAYLSITTFTSILRGSASYFMVLRRMNYQEETE